LPRNKLVDRLVCMKTVGAFEAKTHLNKLLSRVSNGETIRITHRGVPIARLVPDDETEKKDLKKVVEEFRRIREGANLKGTKIRELIHEGHRY